MKKITVDEILALKPCWPEDKLRKLVGKGKTLTQIANAKSVDIADRRWVLTRLAARNDAGMRVLVLWAAGCAQDVRHLVSDDEDMRDAVDVAIQSATAQAEGCATSEDCRDAAYAANAASDAAYYAANAADAAYAASYAASAAFYAASYAADQLAALAAMMEALP
jgi:hypothetical protein